jgi:hypothetical protein
MSPPSSGWRDYESSQLAARICLTTYGKESLLQRHLHNRVPPKRMFLLLEPHDAISHNAASFNSSTVHSWFLHEALCSHFGVTMETVRIRNISNCRDDWIRLYLQFLIPWFMIWQPANFGQNLTLFVSWKAGSVLLSCIFCTALNSKCTSKLRLNHTLRITL